MKIMMMVLRCAALVAMAGCDGEKKSAESIGIIGGADGPTAVFVSGDPIGLILTVAGIAATAALLVTGIVLWVRHKNKTGR